MTNEERGLLLATAALALGRAPPGTLSEADKAFLAPLMGDVKEWPDVVSMLMPLVRFVATQGTPTT